MNKKRIVLIFGIFLFGIFLNSLVSAVCCEKLANGGHWCGSADSASECDPDYNIIDDVQTCQTVPSCQITCVNELTGTCGFSSEAQCLEEEGIVYTEPMDEVPACQQGCCVAGEEAYFVTLNKCKYLATTHNIETDFNAGITTRDACEQLVESIEVGACLISTPIENTCVVTSNSDCTGENTGILSSYLQNSDLSQGIEIDFFEGELCTSPRVNSNCARTQNTECKDGRVYYKDSCGNFANIYDESRYESSDYWRYIIDPYDESLCVVGQQGSATCGNCEKTMNTVCRHEQETNLEATYGDYVCGDLGCTYVDNNGNTREYLHGDSWCEGIGNTLVGISQEQDGLGISESDTERLENQDLFNTPGSRYFKLTCSFGEVILEECSDYRNDVCLEYIETDNSGNQVSSSASCAKNSWAYCFDSGLQTKSSCENSSYFCKWIPGYRWDLQVVPEEDRSEQQGSCTPLIAPGFNFWSEDTQGNLLCAMGNVQNSALFETNIWRNRDNYDRLVSEDDGRFLPNRCIEGCYTLPRYGEGFEMEDGEEKTYPAEIICSRGGNDDPPEEDPYATDDTRCHGISGCTDYQYLTEFYDESECSLGDGLGGEYLSTRQGQYCHRDGDENHWLTGGVGDISGRYDCTPGLGGENRDERKERDYPIFLTHNEWLDSITTRARSIGDCGFKPNNLGEYSEPRSEFITAIFQRLDQEGNVDRNVTARQVIYEGDENARHLLRYDRDGEAYTVQEDIQQTTCADNGGICVNDAGLQANGGTCDTVEGNCLYGLTCCNLQIFEDA